MSIAISVLALMVATAVSVRADSTPVVYYACVNNSSGTIHMISSTGTCASTDQEIVWNQVGPQGPVGPQGAQGPVGPMGPQGPAGPAAPTPQASDFGLTIGARYQFVSLTNANANVTGTLVSVNSIGAVVLIGTTATAFVPWNGYLVEPA